MLEQLLNHIDLHNLCKTTDKILLAVSGGVDSMVMLHLFRQAGFQIGVAHCNFQLRGEESIKDQNLVERVCRSFDIPQYTAFFDVLQYAKDYRVSKQMAARNLRYDFFKNIAEAENYNLVATAHNLNDQFETVILNLTKGTGFEGLNGIPVKNEKIIRPLLFADRRMILKHAVENGISWREDESNSSNDYQRNIIRNKIVPVLSEINPSLENTFRQTLERVNAASFAMYKYLEDFSAKNVVTEGNSVYLNLNAIANEEFPAVVLWELTKNYGFNFDQCKEIVGEHPSGRRFISTDFVLLVDRGHYVIYPLDDKPLNEILIYPEMSNVTNGQEFLLIGHIVDIPGIPPDENTAYLDADQMVFPLRWRPWKAGDSFKPLGMNGRKKISDFLIDKKVSLHDKERVTVVESNGEIVWVVGLRISERFKITSKSSRIFMLTRQKAL